MSNKTYKAVADYFAVLLNEPEPKQDISAQPLQQLLSQVSEPQQQATTSDVTTEVAVPKVKSEVSEAKAKAELRAKLKAKLKAKAEAEAVKAVETVTESSGVTVASPVEADTGPSEVPAKPVGSDELAAALDAASVPVSGMLEEEVPENFQVLYFEVAGLTLAVPLTSLGGIQKKRKVNQLFGKPSWFMGVQVSREQKVNVVDTAMWVMPEKYSDQLAQSLDYQYIILLGDSGWGLSCEKLVDADPLSRDEIKWRQQEGKRPWLAGTVKTRMCGLLNVDRLVELLEQGLGS